MREFILSGLKAVIGAGDSRPFYGLMNTFIFQIDLISKIHDGPFRQEVVGVRGRSRFANKDEGGHRQPLRVMGTWLSEEVSMRRLRDD